MPVVRLAIAESLYTVSQRFRKLVSGEGFAAGKAGVLP
jgi:hypothetical protein